MRRRIREFSDKRWSLEFDSKQIQNFFGKRPSKIINLKQNFSKDHIFGSCQKFLTSRTFYIEWYRTFVVILNWNKFYFDFGKVFLVRNVQNVFRTEKERYRGICLQGYRAFRQQRPDLEFHISLWSIFICRNLSCLWYWNISWYNIRSNAVRRHYRIFNVQTCSISQSNEKWRLHLEDESSRFHRNYQFQIRTKTSETDRLIWQRPTLSSNKEINL